MNSKNKWGGAPLPRIIVNSEKYEEERIEREKEEKVKKDREKAENRNNTEEDKKKGRKRKNESREDRKVDNEGAIKLDEGEHAKDRDNKQRNLVKGNKPDDIDTEVKKTAHSNENKKKFKSKLISLNRDIRTARHITEPT